jgi:hypothetical protein
VGLRRLPRGRSRLGCRGQAARRASAWRCHCSPPPHPQRTTTATPDRVLSPQSNPPPPHPTPTQDWIGLKRLHEKGGLAFESAPGEHMQFTLAWFKKEIIARWLSDPAPARR